MNDQSEAPRRWAAKGETITCINNHPIVDIAQDIYVGMQRSAEHFTNWRQPEPDKSVSVAEIRCAQCKGVWIRGNTRAGYQFHFSGGWR